MRYAVDPLREEGLDPCLDPAGPTRGVVVREPIEEMPRPRERKGTLGEASELMEVRESERGRPFFVWCQITEEERVTNKTKQHSNT